MFTNEEVIWLRGHFEKYLMGINSADKKQKSQGIAPDAFLASYQQAEQINAALMVKKFRDIEEARAKGNLNVKSSD